MYPLCIFICIYFCIFIHAAPECRLENKTTLPPGSAKWNSTIITCIGVTDAVGSTAYSFIRNTQVRQNSTSINDLYDNVFGHDSIFSKLLASGDVGAVATYATALFQVLDSFDEEEENMLEEGVTTMSSLFNVTSMPAGISTLSPAEKEAARGMCIFQDLSLIYKSLV